MTYRLISTKGTRTITGTRDQAIRAAVRMEAELQPSYGISVEDDGGVTVAEVRDGCVAVDDPPADLPDVRLIKERTAAARRKWKKAVKRLTAAQEAEYKAAMALDAAVIAEIRAEDSARKTSVDNANAICDPADHAEGN